MRYKIDIEEINKLYDITEDGLLYSHLRQRWLKPQKNNCGYIFFFVKPYDRWIFAHTLVALRYLGPPPTDKHEVNHKDGNRMNNLWTNLEWVTHSENHLKAYQNGKEHYWLGKHRPSPSLETKLKMASAKNKRVSYTLNGVTREFKSIQEAADTLKTCRKSVYQGITFDKPWKGGKFAVIPDVR